MEQNQRSLNDVLDSMSHSNTNIITYRNLMWIYQFRLQLHANLQRLLDLLVESSPPVQPPTQTTSALNLTNTSLPSSLPPAPAITLSSEMQNKAPNSAIPIVPIGANLQSASVLTTSGPDATTIVPPISNKSIASSASQFSTTSQPIPSIVGMLNSVQTETTPPSLVTPETAPPSLVTPGQLLQSGPSAVASALSSQVAHKDVEVVQVSPLKSSQLTVPVATEAQPPILSLPQQTRPVYKADGIPFVFGKFRTLLHGDGDKSFHYKYIASSASQFSTTSQPIPSIVGMSNSVQTETAPPSLVTPETAPPSLVTPGQLLQSGPSAVASALSSQVAHKDVEVVQVSPPKSSQLTVPVATEAQPPILSLPQQTRPVYKADGIPFVFGKFRTLLHGDGDKSFHYKYIASSASQFSTTSQPIPSIVGMSNSVQTETAPPSLVTPGQLLQSGPSAVASALSSQVAHKDVEVVQVSPPKSSQLTVPVATEAQPPILSLPQQTRPVYKAEIARQELRSKTERENLEKEKSVLMGTASNQDNQDGALEITASGEKY